MDHYADFSFGGIVKVKSDRLEEFRKIADGNRQKKRYRLCLHDTPENQLQDMLICMVKGDYARPHKHHDMPESHLSVLGKAFIVIFSDDGEIKDAFILDREHEYLMYRVNADVYHMTLVLSDTFVEYEVKPGPFCPDNNIYPPWAPDGTDYSEVKIYHEEIMRKIEKFLNEGDVLNDSIQHTVDRAR